MNSVRTFWKSPNSIIITVAFIVAVGILLVTSLTLQSRRIDFSEHGHHLMLGVFDLKKEIPEWKKKKTTINEWEVTKNEVDENTIG